MSLSDKLKKINKTRVAKMVLLGVVGIGVTKIVKDVISDHVETDNKWQEFTVKLATYGIASIASMAVRNKLDENFIVPVIKAFQEAMNPAEEDPIEEDAQEIIQQTLTNTK